MDIDTATLASAIGVPVDYPDDHPARSRGVLVDELAAVSDLLPTDLKDSWRVQVWLEAVSLLVDHFGEEIYVRGNCDQCPFTLAAMARGLENWMLDLVDPDGQEQVVALLEYCTKVTCDMISSMAATGCHMVSNGDSPAGPSMISPRMYRQFALPYEKQCVEEAHKHGLPYCLHICGDTTPILTDMLETGTDSVELDYLTDIEKAHEVCKDRVCFIGNIDPSGVLALGSPDDVRRATEELLAAYSDSPRFILNAGCAIPSDTPSENLRAMIAATRI
jgi:uroporphyrinogen decarboxylase